MECDEQKNYDWKKNRKKQQVERILVKEKMNKNKNEQNVNRWNKNLKNIFFSMKIE